MSQKKKLRMRVIDDMFTGKISVPEAKARIAWVKSGLYRPPVQHGASRVAVMKSAGQLTGFEQYFDSADPQVREWARAAAHQAMVTKGAVPWEPPARQQAGDARAIMRAAGPDGTAGWRVLREALPAGPPFVPPGIAGR